MINEKQSYKYNKHNLIINDLGNLKEIYLYESPTISLKENCKLDRKKSRAVTKLTEHELTERQRKRKCYYNKKKLDIQRLIQCNISQNSFFLTLTYATETSLNDLDRAFCDFKYFITKLNKHFYNGNKRQIKYIATWEFKVKDESKEESKENTRHLHFHAWIDFPSEKKIYIKNKDIANIWGHGFINIRPIVTYEKVGYDLNEEKIQLQSQYVGYYLAKYLAKDLELKHDLKSRKSILISRNLNKPKTQKRYIDILESVPKELSYIKHHPNTFFYNRINYQTKYKSKAMKLFLTNEEYEKLNINNLLGGNKDEKSNKKQ